MKKKSLIIIFFLTISIFIYKNSYKRINYNTYLDDMMRFSILLDGEYSFLDNETYSKFESSRNQDYIFSNNSSKIEIKNISSKFGKYLITNTNVYIFTKIDDKYGWINGTLPIGEETIKYLKAKFSIKQYESLEIIPFNDFIHVLLYSHSSGDAYIVNLKSGEILWAKDSYYESPQINFYTNMLECNGDLSSDKYIFNKNGILERKISWY